MKIKVGALMRRTARLMTNAGNRKANIRTTWKDADKIEMG